jgi:hypothetical protein
MLRRFLRRLLQQPQQGPPAAAAAADPAAAAGDSPVTSDTRPAQVSPQELNMTVQQRQQQQQRQGAQQQQQQQRQQQQQGGGSAGDFNTTGPWQSLQNLAYVDLSDNQLTGRACAVLFRNTNQQEQQEQHCRWLAPVAGTW